jgi:hypothetical protein
MTAECRAGPAAIAARPPERSEQLSVLDNAVALYSTPGRTA